MFPADHEEKPLVPLGETGLRLLNLNEWLHLSRPTSEPRMNRSEPARLKRQS